MSPLPTFLLKYKTPTAQVPSTEGTTTSPTPNYYNKCKGRRPSFPEIDTAVSWEAIEFNTKAVELFYMKLSPNNANRMFLHRSWKSPALRRAYTISYFNCARDWRRRMGRELARQILTLLKGPDREEYRMRMVRNGWKQGTMKKRRRKEEEEEEEELGGEGKEMVSFWTGRLR